MGKRLYTWLLLSLGVVTGALAQSMAISGGNDHSLFICTKGVLYACGDNTDGRLGLTSANAGTQYVPSFSQVDITGLAFSQVTAGSGAHNVALACNGIVYCWGANDAEMSCGQPASQKYVTTPTPVLCGEAPGYNLDGTPGGPYLGGVTYIAASTSGSFAILEDGRVVGWGGNGSYGDGQWIEKATATPVFIRTKDKQPITGVTHISGGDNNLLLKVDPDGDGLGDAYSIGNYNGRGGDIAAHEYYAEPVLKMKDENVQNADAAAPGEPLTNIKMLAAADAAGFAVDGITGYVYAWGENGGNGRCGLPYFIDYLYAARVLSGDYVNTSGETYLTDVIEVIGGNGYGAAITKEGYMLYWGKNNSENDKVWGGVVPDPDFKGQGTNDTESTIVQNGVKVAHKNGPVYAKYGDGSVVDNAVHLARGDLFGFMVNDKDEYYVWGQTASTAQGNPHVGHMATGKVEDYKNYLYKIQTPCAPADPCPTTYMVGPVYKCPGAGTSLYSGFTPSLGKEDVYEFFWYKDGVKMDETKYNKATIDIDEPGTYKVGVVYVGSNTMCEACDTSFASVEVIDMEMPIDTIMTQTCASVPPTASNVIPYEFKVNDKFYKSGENTTWVVYDKEQNGTPLDTLDVKVGGKGSFSVKGNFVKVNENAPIDTTYSIWIEDATKKNELFLKNTKIVDSTVTLTHPTFGDMSDQAPCFFTFETKSDFSLGTFSLVLKGNGQAVSNLVVTASVYSTDRCTNNGNVTYSAKSKLTSISKSVPSLDTVPKVVLMDFEGFSAPVNKVRGTSYIIVVSVNKQVKALVQNATAGTSIFSGAIKLIDGGLDYKSAPECYSKNDYNFAIHNLEFFKLTDYTCGRIELQCRLYCPPCTSPDEVKMLVDGVAKTSDTISLCEESPEVELSVEDIKSTQNSSAAFDVLWFVDQLGAETDAAQVDKKAAASTYKTKIKWSAAKEGTTEKYYVRGRDNENPSDSHCFAEDSVVVKYNKKPVVPTIEIPSFCKGLVDDAVKSYLNNDLKTLLNGLKADILDPSNAAVAVADLATSLNALAAGTQTYKISVTDLATGCISEVSSFDVKVKAIPDKPDVTDIDFLVSEETSQPVGDGVPAQTGDIHWYSNKSDFPANPSTAVPTVSLKEEKTFTFWVSKNVDGCESDTSSFLVTVNDAPVPAAHDTLICVQNSVTNPNPSVDLTTLVTAGDPKNPNTAFTLNWYTDPNAAKGSGSATAPTVDYTKVGAQTFYVSQTNGDTHAESNKKAFSVKIYKAHTLSPIAEDTYCDDNQNPRVSLLMV